MEYKNLDDEVGTALMQSPLKDWFDEVIVKSFDAKTYYHNHLDYHFGKKSALHLTWRMLLAFQDHILIGVEYPEEYHPTPKKESKAKAKDDSKSDLWLDAEIESAGMTTFINEIKKEQNVEALPEQAVKDAIAVVKQKVYSLSDPDDVKTLKMTIVEAITR